MATKDSQSRSFFDKIDELKVEPPKILGVTF